MRFPEVTQSETMFSLFLTPDHQKMIFFIRNRLLGLIPRLQPQNPTHAAVTFVGIDSDDTVNIRRDGDSRIP